jgi:hypothetical protein
MFSLKPVRVPAILAACQLTWGCGMARDMGEMHDATLGMSQTTAQMIGTTNGMAADMSKMLKITQGMAGDTSQMLKITQGMAGDTGQMLKITQKMGTQMTEMNLKLDQTNKAMAQMDARMAGMNRTMVGMDSKMASMNRVMGTVATDMKVMKGYTREMNRKTTRLAVDAAAMRQMTSQLRDITSNMNMNFDIAYVDGRRDGARRARQESLDHLERSPSLYGKLIHAGTYFLSMEFQLWKPIRDKTDARESMFEYMVMEFLGLAQNYTTNSGRVDLTDFDIADKDSQHQNLFALVTAMHLVDKLQIKSLQQVNSKEPPVSMLMLLEDGLRAKSLVESGAKKMSDLLPYQQKVLNSEQLVVYLLQVRQLFTRAAGFMLLRMEPTGNEPSVWSLISKKLFKSSRTTPLLQNRNTSQLHETAEIFEMAAESAQFLRSIGIQPERNENVDLFLTRMKPIEVPKSLVNARDQALQRLSNAYLANLPNPRMFIKGPFNWKTFPGAN